MKRRDEPGRYAKRPATEIEKMCREFAKDEYGDPITAVESPNAMTSEPNGKRSGTYAKNETKAEELQRLRARCSGGE